tara:strand:- start:648 stop:1139 length:492 start_codon:yes stop_codon:yes gene_type:complete
MNKIQAALRDQILDTVKNIKKHKVGEILNWLLRNQIAKYSLANDYYFSTQFTLDQVKKMNLDVTKRSIKTKKNKITYEHPIPSKVVFDLILKAKSEIEIIDILKKTDYIVILSHYEDEKLRIKGLISSMPEGWSYGDNVFARYEKANIEVLTKKIKMTGAIRR